VIEGVSTGYTYEDGLLKQAGDSSFSYNGDGSQAAKSNGADQWDYIYDDLGQLETVNKNDAAIGSYGYNPFGWRIWKEENGK